MRRPIAEDDAPDTTASALDVEAGALRLLAQREHSRHELNTKLVRRFGQSETLLQVLDELEQRGLLSDERFTECYVAMRMHRGYGPLRIRAELRERGIEGELAEIQLDLGSEDWLKHLRAVAVQRFGQGEAADRKEQARRARFLQYRGFPESLVRRYLWG